MIRLVLALLLLLLVPAWVEAACSGASPTWTASADRDSIQECITNAASGDTVNISAGTFAVSTQITITGKSLILAGAGIGSTILQSNMSSVNAPAIAITASAVNIVTVSGITFQDTTKAAQGMLNVTGTRYDQAFRFHHVRMENDIDGSRGIQTSDVYGLIDNSEFYSTGSVQSISIFGSNTSTDGGYGPWAQALSLGSANAVYVEDNTFERTTVAGEDAVDLYSGARAVIRYNTFTESHAGFHGTDSGGYRSPVSVEVYNNTYNNSTGTAGAGRMRGGTGVWFNNTWATTGVGVWQGISLLNYRACAPNTFTWNACDGADLELGSATLVSNASRTCSTTGGFRFDATTNELLGAESGTYTKYFDNGGAAESGSHGYPCRDQVGRAPGQALEPIYAWNNTGGVTLAANDAWSSDCGGFGIANYILENRDFYNNGVTPKPGYTAYTYPHPLQDAGAPPIPDPVSTFTVGSTTAGAYSIIIWSPVDETDADFGGYRVYCGTSPGVYDSAPAYATTPSLARSQHTSSTRALITFPTAGTYYCAGTVYDLAGVNSDYSSEVTVVSPGSQR